MVVAPPSVSVFTWLSLLLHIFYLVQGHSRIQGCSDNLGLLVTSKKTISTSPWGLRYGEIFCGVATHCTAGLTSCFIQITIGIHHMLSSHPHSSMCSSKSTLSLTLLVLIFPLHILVLQVSSNSFPQPWIAICSEL